MYKLTSNKKPIDEQSVIRLTDNVVIPPDKSNYPNMDRHDFNVWVLAGNTPEPADPTPTIYDVTPAQTVIRVNTDAVVTVTGTANDMLTLYAYPVDVVPDASHELDVTLDDTGRGVVKFVPDSIGQWAIRGTAGALVDTISIIQAVA
jgi:hypothetical protein